MGTQVLGVTSDRDAASSLARQFFRFDPSWVKKYEPIYATAQGASHVIDYRSVEFTIEEQALLKSYDFTNQGRYHFLVRRASSEGNTVARLRAVTLENFDKNLFVNEDLAAQARELLMEKRGVRVGEILREIDSRPATEPPATITSDSVPANGRKLSLSLATIISDDHSDEDKDHPILREKKTPSQSS